MRVLDLLRGVILDALARFEMLLLSQMLLFCDALEMRLLFLLRGCHCRMLLRDFEISDALARFQMLLLNEMLLRGRMCLLLG